MLGDDHPTPRRRRPISPAVREQLRAIGAAIRAARLARRMPVADLAGRLGVNRETVARIQRGDGGVGWATVLEAAHLVGLDLFEEVRRGTLPRASGDPGLLPQRARRPARTVDDDF